MLGKSAHLQVISQQSTQTQQTRGCRHATKTSGLVYWCRTGAHFIPRINFTNLGSFAKVSCKNYNSLFCNNSRSLLAVLAESLIQRWCPTLQQTSIDCLVRSRRCTRMVWGQIGQLGQGHRGQERAAIALFIEKR